MHIYLVVQNFHPAAGVVEEPQDLVFNVQQLLLIRGNASHKVVMTFFQLGLLQSDYLRTWKSEAELRGCPNNAVVEKHTMSCYVWNAVGQILTESGRACIGG